MMTEHCLHLFVPMSLLLDILMINYISIICHKYYNHVTVNLIISLYYISLLSSLHPGVVSMETSLLLLSCSNKFIDSVMSSAE